MEIEYSLFIFTNLFLFLNLLNSCFVFRRFHRIETRIKAIEDSNESQQNRNTNQSSSQQAVLTSYPPITTPTYPQYTYAQQPYYRQPYNTYQAPSAPPYNPSASPYNPSAPSL